MKPTEPIVYVIFIIFTGTAVLSTLALYTRQSLLVAYMALGAILGPWGFKLVKNSDLIHQTGEIGIIFLLFLLGLNLQPQNLYASLRKMAGITLTSSFCFWLMGFLISLAFHFSITESTIIGITMMFSSTIIGLKLLPTTMLHHQHTGELMISILLLQDMLAIGALLVLHGIGDQAFSLFDLIKIIGAFPILLIIAYFFQRFILAKLLQRFDQILEYTFILSIAWCLAMAEIAHGLGLSAEIGAFIAGVALASNPITFYIAESLRPLRDFFLVIFFFTIGAGFNFTYFPLVIWPALALALMMLLIKPGIFALLIRRSGETLAVGKEVGVRLGQSSEFSLLVAYLALHINLISLTTNYVIQAAMILTFIVSSYWVVFAYPTPVAFSDKLRRD